MSMNSAVTPDAVRDAIAALGPEAKIKDIAAHIGVMPKTVSNQRRLNPAVDRVLAVHTETTIYRDAVAAARGPIGPQGYRKESPIDNPPEWWERRIIHKPGLDNLIMAVIAVAGIDIKKGTPEQRADAIAYMGSDWHRTLCTAVSRPVLRPEDVRK